jgi:hypothetical protein
MPGLVPGIYAIFPRKNKDVDGRDKPGHDEFCYQSSSALTLANTLRNIFGVSTPVLVL